MSQEHHPNDPLPPTTGHYDSVHIAKVVAAVREMKHPSQIGPYHIIAPIGEGGMGIVYKAEQRAPIRRVVALKIIKLGMDTRQVIARFESERQALAMMSHPNVAKVLDAGATDTGRPYFVMEYVAGEPITKFADRQKLTTHQRLELFLQACAAIQHAHQKAIIHRDLKPSNIMVTVQDDKPVVKVIDFGVAKAVSHRLTDKSLFTETGQIVGTPEYMSPEQAEGSGVDVDTRTDVYSLGVILYELLSGSLPFDPRSLRSAGYHEVQRIIREVDPPRPSTRLSSMGDDAQRVAALRQTPLELLSRQLRSELEWIPLKAMRKDRTHRYTSPMELADDVSNYLKNRPLRAGPESAAYRVRKFLRRNRVAVTAAAGIGLAIVIGGIVSTVLAVKLKQSADAVRAEQLRTLAALEQVQSANDSAREVIEFLTDDVLGSASPFVSRGRDVTVKQAVDAAAARVAGGFDDRPLVEAAVRHALATIYVEMGHADLALPHAKGALDVRQRLLPPDSIQTLEARGKYGNVLAAQGKFDESEAVQRQVLEQSADLPYSDINRIIAARNYTNALSHLGRYAEAEKLAKATLDAARAVRREDDAEILKLTNDYASVVTLQGRLAEAEPIYRSVLEISRKRYGDDHPDTIAAMQTYAYALQATGQFVESEKLYRDALAVSSRVLGADHTLSVVLLQQLGDVTSELGRHEEALQLSREALEKHRRTLGADHPDTIISINSLATSLVRANRMDEADVAYREVLERQRRALGEDHPDTITSLCNCGYALWALKRDAEAEPLFADAYERGDRVLGPQHPAREGIYRGYARVLTNLKRYDQAEPLQKRLVDHCTALYGEQHASTRRAMTDYASLLEAMHRYDDAKAVRARLPATTQPASQPS